MISRILSTPVLLAASISITSRAEPRRIARQISQVPQGVGVGLSPAIQFKDLARMRAEEVLPVPLGPVNR